MSASAAEIYESFFVPALFGQWPDRVLDSAGVRPGDRVLDVGCGTGVLARAAARRVTAGGSVAGLDVNEDMLAIARRCDDVAWHVGAAEELPFADASFDRVVSQFAAMFFIDRSAAVHDMARVVRSGGTVTIATWASVELSPGYAAMVELLDRVVGGDAADALRVPFALGEPGRVREMLKTTLGDVTVGRHEGTARFESLDAWVHTDVRGWTLADVITDAQYAELLDAARIELASFTDPRGRVSFPAPAIIGTGTRLSSPGG